MKILHSFVLLAVAGTLLGAPEMQAQDMSIELTPFAGGTFFLSDPPASFALHRRGGQDNLVIQDGSFDHAFLTGMNAGIKWGERYSIEGMFSWMPTTLTAPTGTIQKVDANVFMYGVTFLYSFPLAQRIDPYLGVGVGGETFNYDMATVKTHSDVAGIAVLGLSLDLTERFALRLDARDCFAKFNSGVLGVGNTWENDLMLSMGLNLHVPIGR